MEAQHDDLQPVAAIGALEEPRRQQVWRLVRREVYAPVCQAIAEEKNKPKFFDKPSPYHNIREEQALYIGAPCLSVGLVIKLAGGNIFGISSVSGQHLVNPLLLTGKNQSVFERSLTRIGWCRWTSWESALACAHERYPPASAPIPPPARSETPAGLNRQKHPIRHTDPVCVRIAYTAEFASALPTLMKRSQVEIS